MEQYLLDFNWKVMAPELIIVSAAALLSLIDLLFKEHASRKWIGILGFLAVIAAESWVIYHLDAPAYQILGDTYRVDALSMTFKAIILAGAALVLLLSLSVHKRNLETSEGEFYYLFLTATLGAMMMVSSADFITLYVGLELLSISSYILVGIRKKHLQSNEAAWKYLVLGGVSSAFILYGMSFVYGLTGSTNLFIVQQRLMEVYTQYDMFVILSLFLMMVGFGFKIATVPFQMWAPDVYQGAMTPVTAFLAVVSKTAAFAFVIRIILIAYMVLINYQQWTEIVMPMLMIIAAASMIVGNIVALKQTDIKRLMAYSSIAQAGYILVPLITLSNLLFSATVFYLIAYLLMTLGVFAIIQTVTSKMKTSELKAFAGLHQRSPWLAAGMTVLLISLAGLPLTAGFIGKFYLITNTFLVGKFWLAGVMILTTVISYYYYFGIIRQMYFRSPVDGEKVAIPFTTAFVILVGVVGTIGLGVAPDWLLTELGSINWGSGFNLAENVNPATLLEQK
ncbi:NADH-quinone oxidoreductase subunit N [Hazenella coriacea]|uniref:NADH-quinone oxidoreductase subunit N n=1 Tax=Hazenella coriacea TaxID=1179467 RepID=A0A4R3L8T3_9BACL|nr:NADH-quinone oxidoreductase subunit N [Hazenella coriacea]TCS95608.1 NADH-quinone oxidoreductase subunit N [Hazenella coriacea]